MSLHYVIDGYNITKHPLFSRQIDKNTEDHRCLFLRLIRLHKLTGSPRNQVTVVFDGYPGYDRNFNDIDAAITVVFSRKQTADDKIKGLLQRYGNPKNIYVVSNDQEIRLFAKAFGARAISIEEFLNAREKSHRKEEEALDVKLNFSQMEKINQELRRIWLVK